MKDKNTAAIMAIFLGGIGGHKFYLGQTGWGIAYVIFCWTFIPAGIAFIEAIMLLTMSNDVFNARYNAGLALPATSQPQNIVVNVQQHAGALPAGGVDISAQLKQLHDLKVAGALSEDEFASEKRKLLAANGTAR